MKPTLPFLKEPMAELLEAWSNVNSGSDNISGLARMLELIKKECAVLKAETKIIPIAPRKKIDSAGQVIDIPNGEVLFLKKHPNAPIQIFLGGHYDTVYGEQHYFQKAERLENGDLLRGPGTADMKGGLIIMLKALEALEKSSVAGKIGWEVLINPDEEVGSMSSEHLFRDCAKRAQLGLLFEPSFSDGSLVSARKGSANFSVIARGKAAHAGRDFHEGRSAIAAMGRFIHDADDLNSSGNGVTINFGHIEGGGPVNIVPDLAICRINMRGDKEEALEKATKELHRLVKLENETEGLNLTIVDQSARAPKPFDEKTKLLFESLKESAAEIGMNIKWQPSGGVCDGNILAAEGVPTIDTLGVIGGNIHTSEEYANLDSLPHRAQLTAYFLTKIAKGEIHV